MDVLVDTSVWSLALRRRAAEAAPSPEVAALTDLIHGGRAVLIGAVRQELLSGIRHVVQYEALRTHLRAFPAVPVGLEDYEDAAACSNLCRARGVQGSAVDFLICAVARRRNLPILTTDKDFERYAPIVDIRLYES